MNDELLRLQSYPLLLTDPHIIPRMSPKIISAVFVMFTIIISIAITVTQICFNNLMTRVPKATGQPMQLVEF